MRIFGVDCGTAITGWAVVDVQLKARKPMLIDYGMIETHKFTPEEHRLRDLGESTAELLDEYSPDHLAIEDLFFFRNSTTVIKVGQARGVVIYEAAKRNLEYHSYSPVQVKKAITGYGRAEKSQMLMMVNNIFGLRGKLKQDDTADAIAVAYCHYLNLS